MRMRLPGCDYCRQCLTDFRWRKVSPQHPERLYCDCQWAKRLRVVDSELLEDLRAEQDDIARAELMRRMQPVKAA